MATEALNLPRNAITIRPPRRLHVLLRAWRVARSRRALKLYRELADRDERVMADVGVNPRRLDRPGWLTEIVLMYQQN